MLISKYILSCSKYIFFVISLGDEACVQEIDPWDMLDPVDVLAKLPANFMESIDSKKWVERRDALQSLLVLCTENPKLCPKANYGEFVALLKKVTVIFVTFDDFFYSTKLLFKFVKGNNNFSKFRECTIFFCFI